MSGGRADRVIYQVASWCLSYPDEALVERVGLLAAAVGELPTGRARTGLGAIVDHLASSPLDRLQGEYVELFDLSRKRALYLSYWTDGDTRRRGEVLGTFKARYRESGFLVDTRGEPAAPGWTEPGLPARLPGARVLDPALRAAAALRRRVRPQPPACPAPVVLDRRRHPAAR